MSARGGSPARQAAPVFAALGDTTRLRLMHRLSSEGPLSITRLSEGSGITRQAITRHLHALGPGRELDVELLGCNVGVRMGVLPFCALSFMMVSHWEHVEAIFDKNKKADFSLRPKEVPLKPKAVLKIFSLLTSGLVIPYLEELYRCIKAEKQGLKIGQDTPPHVKQKVHEYVDRKKKGLDRWF
jgi:DNA-binding transcriptional ArsR family regulator